MNDQRSFPFERTLVNRELFEWVCAHETDILSRTMTDAHLRAQREGSAEAIGAYRQALVWLNDLKPWVVRKELLVVK